MCQNFPFCRISHPNSSEELEEPKSPKFVVTLDGVNPEKWTEKPSYPSDEEFEEEIVRNVVKVKPQRAEVEPFAVHMRPGTGQYLQYCTHNVYLLICRLHLHGCK